MLSYVVSGLFLPYLAELLCFPMWVGSNPEVTAVSQIISVTLYAGIAIEVRNTAGIQQLKGYCFGFWLSQKIHWASLHMLRRVATVVVLLFQITHPLGCNKRAIHRGSCSNKLSWRHWKCSAGVYQLHRKTEPRRRRLGIYPSSFPTCFLLENNLTPTQLPPSSWIS